MMHHEKDIIGPAVKVMRSHGGICSTGDLIKDLKDILPLDEEDLEILPSADFARIDQIIRNLKCNGTLERLGLAEYYDGGFILTEKGWNISDDDLRVISEFVATTHSLTPQKAMFKYVEMKGIKFISGREAASVIRKRFPELGVGMNDGQMMEAISRIVDEYVASHPGNVVSV